MELKQIYIPTDKSLSPVKVMSKTGRDLKPIEISHEEANMLLKDFNFTLFESRKDFRRYSL